MPLGTPFTTSDLDSGTSHRSPFLLFTRHAYVREASRPQCRKTGLLWAQTLHTPLREVGYVAFSCVQGR